MDGNAAALVLLLHVLPHLARPITVVILIETIFLLTCRGDLVTTGGGPGNLTTNIPFLVYARRCCSDVGGARPAHRRRGHRQHRRLFLVRMIGRNLGA